MNNRLQILKKKTIGKFKFNAYQNHFRDFSISKHIDLERSEILLQSLNYIHSSEEIIDSESSFIESELLRKLYIEVEEGSTAYAFTDDFEYCGIYLVKTKEAIEKSFRIAREDYNHTFFILEAENKFFVRINFYDSSHPDFASSFDIQISKN